MNYIDLLIISLYLVICLCIGFIKKKSDNNLKGFTFCRDITLPALICTVFASTIGAGSSLGDAEKVYVLGFSYMLSQCFQPLYWLISAYIIAPGIERFKGCFTISDIMRKLYGRPAEIITSLMALVMSIGSLSIQAIALGKVFNYFLDIHETIGILIGYFIIVVYSTCGGMRAIIYNDMFKTLIVFFVLPITCIMASINGGGVDQIALKLPSSHFIFEFTSENIILIVSLLFGSMLPSFDAELVQRYLMAKNANQLKKTFLWVFFCSIIFGLAIISVGYMVRALAPGIQPSEVFNHYIENFLPIGLKGLMIAGLIAIIIAMAEAKLNAGGLIIYKNCLSYFFPKLPKQKQLTVFRIIICSLALASVTLLHFSSKSILDIFFFLRNFWTPVIFIPAIAGFIGFKTTYKTFIVSTIFALASVIGGAFYAGSFATISYMFGVIGCGVGFFGAHYFQVLYNNLPKQPELINFTQDIKVSFHKWQRRLVNDYKRHRGEKPKYNLFLAFAFMFLALSGMHMFLYSTEQMMLFALWGLVHLLALPLTIRESLFSHLRMQKILPYYFRAALTSLSVLSSYILLTHQGNDYLLLTGAFSAICIIHIVDPLRALIHFTAGLGIAFLLFVISGEAEVNIMALKYIPIVYGYFFFISYTVVRTKEYEHAEMVETLHVFGGAMAHEVKSPLATLNMCAQTLSMIINSSKVDGKIVLDPEKAEIVEDISNSIYKVSKIGVNTVDTLLITMKNEIKPDDLKVQKISKVVINSLDKYNSTSEKPHQVKLIKNADFELKCSQYYITQILSNLLNNAFKYGGRDVNIEIIIEKRRIIFQDNGRGIPAKSLPYIFDRFYTNSNSGTGLGLAFCKMAIESMKGSITCESKVGEYTKFFITF